MAMQPLAELCVNKGGTFTIRDRFTNEVLGTLYNREAYLYLFDDGEGKMAFLSSDGTLKTVQPNFDGLTYHTCIDYPYSTEVMDDGQEYYIFKIRKTSTVYDAAKNVWGTVAAGMYVATKNAEMGTTEMTWKEINYVKSTSGTWVKVTGSGYNHGYVDCGIGTASGYASMNLYGSW